jgi:hypothetical protein
MIVNEAGEKCTPKDKAKEVMVDAIKLSIEKWIEDHPEDISQMTDRELDLLNDQLLKLLKRVYKMLGIEELVVDGEVENL